MTTLILASGSRYRAQLLERLRLPFTVAVPEVDETPRRGEFPASLTRRLANAKADAVASRSAGAWVLGSDQVADIEGRILGKPGDHASAVQQLTSMSGRTIHFHTSICLRHADGRRLQALDITTVRFRALAAAEIERYLLAEQPYDCAGSFQCEGLGISLFKEIQSRDPTALVGLPLIATADLLREAGFAVP
ncbi:Maf family protein [Novilysobacter antarcticus]|uniref:Maf family protein n=1 Tax=Novilysobacter antarcticus TaxID=2862543 RepID=UPI001C9953D2